MNTVQVAVRSKLAPVHPQHDLLGDASVSSSKAFGVESKVLDCLTPVDLPFSNVPDLIFCRISLQTSSNALSTFSPDFALASRNRRPSSFAHCSASSVATSRFLEEPPSGHRSTLFATNIQLKWGSAYSLTSASQLRVLTKLARDVTSYTKRAPAAPR